VDTRETMAPTFDGDRDDRVADDLPSRKDITTCIRQAISSTLGVAGERPASELQVRFWDPNSRLLLLRVPRDECGRVRASLTLWGHLPLSSSSSCRIVASVLSVNGSARTAKRSALHTIQKYYRQRIGAMVKTNRKRFEKECKKLQELIGMIQAID